MENGLNVTFPAAPPATVDSSASLNSLEVTEAALRSAGASSQGIAEFDLARVNLRWNGTPYQHPKGTPLIGVFCW
jgi:hypothetical protein